MECFLCGANGSRDPLDGHHIFGAANRKLSEKLGLYVDLCHHKCHLFGTGAAHNNAEVMLALHKWGQRKAMEKLAIDRNGFRMLFGHNYLEDWEPDEERVEMADDFEALPEMYLPADDWVC